MIKKRPTLSDVFSNEQPQQEEAEEQKPSVNETRRRYRIVNLYLMPDEKEVLRVLAFEERKKIHDLVIEGLDRVLADRGLETISERRVKVVE